MSKFVNAAKESLTHIGEACSRPALLSLNSTFNYLWVGHWMKSRGFRVEKRVDTHLQVFEVAAKQIRDRQVLYLEFGVYRGESMKVWSNLLRHPRSHLHGFDSFEGLPEAWDLSAPKGDFDIKGSVPVIDDPRVELFKGWFSQTLPHYVLPPHEQLVVNFDADLYSSTKTALEFLKPHITVGTYLYFDQFQAREHESKAFDELLSETGWKFRVAAASRGLTNVLFQRVVV